MTKPLLPTDDLIYGRNKTNRIVSIEVNDGHAEIFQQNEEGGVDSSFITNKFWLLADKPAILRNWAKLGGELHYKYGAQFDTRQDFVKFRSILKKKDIDTFSIWDEKESCMVNKGLTYFKGLKPNEVTTLSFDIETNGLIPNADSRIFLISNTLRKNGIVTRKLFSYDDYSNDGTMIDAWCEWVRNIDPSILLGHNIVTYDLPYIQHVANLHNADVNLGRNYTNMEISNYESSFRVDGSRDQAYKKIKIYGREIIDTLMLAIKYDTAKKYETYGLKNIIKQEGLEVVGRQHYEASTIKDNYTNPEEWEKIKAYAMHDADDSLALFDLMIPAYFYMNQSVPKSFQSMIESATGSQLNSIMVRAYLQDGHSIPKADIAEKYEGAISFGNSGIYNNVHKVDVVSLYPSIMIQYEVFDEDKDPKGHFLTLVKTFTAERIKNKKLFKETGDRHYDDLQSAQKIAANSLYGFLGTPGLPFNCPSAAAFITERGREILTDAMNWATSKGFKITNGDTDSISYCKSDMSEISEEERKALLAELNSLFPVQIKFEDDGYDLRQCILKAKNYIRWDGKKITLKGSALKSATLEPRLKEFINDIIHIIIHISADPGRMQHVYLRYIREIMALQDIKPWCSKKSITATTLASERANETKIMDAIEGSEYSEGDKIYVFFKEDGTLSLAEHFNGDYSRDKLLEKLYKASQRFETVLPEDLFLNYKLKRNKKLLEAV